MIIQLLGSRVAVWPVRAGGCAELTIVLHAQKLESVDASGLKLDSRASFLPPRICMSLHRTPELASTEPSASVVAVAYQRSWAIRLAVLHAFAVPATEGLKMSAVLVPRSRTAGRRPTAGARRRAWRARRKTAPASRQARELAPAWCRGGETRAGCRGQTSRSRFPTATPRW